MKPPRRFTATHSPGLEGHLLALGKEETPDAEAKLRVARRLGVSGTTLAAAATLATTSAKAAAASGVTAAKSLVAPATSSFVTATLVKATVIGIGLGLASYAGVKVYVSHSPPSMPSVTQTYAAKPPERTGREFAIASQHTATIDAVVEVERTRGTSGPLAIPSAPSSAPEDSADSRAPVIRAVGRFEDDIAPPAPSTEGPVESARSVQLGPTSMPASNRSTVQANPQLAREVASLDLVRASANRGDTAGALRELTAFERNFGYVALRHEAMLVHIDVLLSLGRREQAAALARDLLRFGAPATQRNRLEQLVREQR